MSVNKRVHCHICPLKELCPHEASDASWRKAKEERFIISAVYTEPGDDEAVRIATANCPLRGVLK